MQSKTVEYGSTIRFSETFKDSSGNALTPDSAEVVLSFADITSKATTRVVVAMTQASPSDPWVASWESSAAWRGAPVYWNARAVGAETVSVFGIINFDFNVAALPDPA